MTLEVDLHGLSVCSAIRVIQRMIVQNPKCTCIEAIHGYNSGNVLKTVLSNKVNIHNKRVLKTLPVPFNDGRTMIILK